MENLKNSIRNILFRKDGKLNNWYRKYITPEIESQILNNTLKCNGNMVERIYWIMNDLSDYPICICGNKITKFQPTLYQYNKTCCKKCRNVQIGKTSKEILNSKSKEEWIIIKNKQKKTNYKKYKNENYRNIKQQKQTLLIKYGVTNISQLDVVKKQKKATSLTNNGYEFWFQSEAGRQYVINNNKTRNYTMSLETHQKWLKSCFNRKHYTLPSGKCIKLQGYEPIVLDILLNSISEYDITTNVSDMPLIFYTYENKNRRYFPDIYIHKLNLIIEVKSTYTMKLHYNKNIAKALQCNKDNINFHFYILDKEHQLEIIEYNVDE